MTDTATTDREAGARLGFLPPDAYEAAGPDGKGRNRLRLEVLSPARRCPLRPLTYEAAWEAQSRPAHARLSWASFGPCTGADCESCPAAAKGATLYAPTVAREDEQGRLWLMNRRRDGWGEFGIPYATWGDLLAAWDARPGARGRDEHGPYFDIYPAH